MAKAFCFGRSKPALRTYRYLSKFHLHRGPKRPWFKSLSEPSFGWGLPARMYYTVHLKLSPVFNYESWYTVYQYREWTLSDLFKSLNPQSAKA